MIKRRSEGQTTKVRSYVRDHYVRPARRERQATFRVLVGDIHRALGFKNRVPLVCNALASRKFLAENSLRLLRRTGPPSGQSTTVELTFELLDPERRIEGIESLRGLRGAGKHVFRALGGGEKFLRAQRSAFSRSMRQQDGR
ncbi:MAG TPA: hypothetical protein VJR04_03965 [Terriglobales bacterium]|nr:hypothetical protein [Terriglobales bacterium]